MEGEGGRSGKRGSVECVLTNAQIVMSDADIKLAVEGALGGAFGTAGQRCTATSRLLLHRDIYEEFMTSFIQQANALTLGNGLKAGVQVGPLINQKQLDRVLSYIEIGKKEGATLLLGGERATTNDLAKGFFVRPTLFGNVTRSMKIFQEDIFGPVLSVVRVSR